MKISVEGVYSGQRLDNFLLDKIGKDLGITRSTLIKYIEPAVKVNGKTCKKSKELDLGDIVEVDYEYFASHTKEIQEDKILAVKGDLTVLDENSEYIILNKTKGVAVHPGKGNENNTIANYLKYYLEQKGEYDKTVNRAGIVHRLDKDVSGILLCAKTKAAQLYYQDKFENREVIKIYLASIKSISRVLPESENDLNTEVEKIIESEFDFDQRWVRIEGHIARDPRNRLRMRLNDEEVGRLAITNMLPLKNNQLLVNIQTGRMHQIRASISALGWVVKGDLLYGDIEKGKGIELEQIILSVEDMSGNRKIWRLV